MPAADAMRPVDASPPRCLVPVAVALGLGCLLRLAFLGAMPLDMDEGWTFGTVTSELGVVEKTGLDPHPLTYYLLCDLMRPVVVLDAWGLRLPSALCAVGALLLWPACLKRLGVHGHVRAWCVLLFALLPLNVYYARQARAYGLAQMCGMLALWAYAWARQMPNRKRLVLLGAMTALSCHVDAFGLAIPFAILIHAAWEGLRKVAPWRLFTAVLIGGALAAPYYIFRVLYMLGGEMHGGFSAAALGPVDFAERIVQLSPLVLNRIDFMKIASRVMTVPPETYLLVVGAVFGLVVLGIRAARGWAPSRALYVLLMVVPVLSFGLVSWLTGAEVTRPRYMLVMLPGFVPLLVLGGLRALRVIPGLAYLLFLVMPLVVCAVVLLPPYRRLDYGALHAQIASEVRPGDGFTVLTYGNIPDFTLEAWCAYAWWGGAPIPDAQRYEFDKVREPSDDRPRSVAKPEDWQSESHRQALIDFVRSCPSGRVWMLSGVYNNCWRVDLHPHARLVETWNASRPRIELWERVALPDADPVTQPATAEASE